MRSTTRLDRNTDRRRDLADDIQVAPAAVPGAIQVDDVEPASAGRREPAGERNRIFLEAADLVEISLTETGGPAGEQVDSRNY